MTAETTPLIERLLAEADLCGNEGADDIAKLLYEAAGVIDKMHARERACNTANEAEIIALVRMGQELAEAMGLNPLTASPADIVQAAALLRAGAAKVPDVPEGCTPADARILREGNHALAMESHELQEVLADLHKQVKAFCYIHGEADFETGKADALLRRLRPDAINLSGATPPAPDAGVVEPSRPPLPFLPATLTVEQIRGAVQAVVNDEKGPQ